MEDRLIGVGEVAEMCGIGTRTAWRLRDQGKLPEPVNLGARLVRWRVSDVAAWIAAGCPDCRRTGWRPPAAGGCGCGGGGCSGRGGAGHGVH